MRPYDKTNTQNPPALKAKLVLAAVRRNHTLAERFEMDPNQIQSWKNLLVDAAKEAFTRDRGGVPNRQRLRGAPIAQAQTGKGLSAHVRDDSLRYFNEERPHHGFDKRTPGDVSYERKPLAKQHNPTRPDA